MNTVKFLVFSDIHHAPGVMLTNSPERLDKILDRAKSEKVDFIVELGDYCHNAAKYPEFMAKFYSTDIPAYHVFGNHDFEQIDYRDAPKLFGLDSYYYYFDVNGFRFVAIDENWYRVGDDYYHYSMADYYGKSRDWIPPEELEWIRETIFSSPHPCILMTHASLEDMPGGVKQAPYIRKMIREANADKRRVLMCMCGHHHCDYMSIVDKVVHFSVNSASVDATSMHYAYPKEWYDEYEWMGGHLIYEDPLSAIVTLRDDGYIKIDGTYSRYYEGIDRVKAGIPNAGDFTRPSSAEISSAELKLF